MSARLRQYVFGVLDRWVREERRRMQQADREEIALQDARLRAWSDRAWQGHVHGNCLAGCPFAHAGRAGSSFGATT